jgi:hypothetical protein
VLTGGQEKLLRQFDLTRGTGSEAMQTLTGHTETIKVALYLNEHTVISGGGDQALRFVSCYVVARRHLRSFGTCSHAKPFFPRRIWDLRSGKESSNVPTKGAINGLGSRFFALISPKSQFCVVVFRSGNQRGWQAAHVGCRSTGSNSRRRKVHTLPRLRCWVGFS